MSSFCNCKENVKQALLDNFKEIHPEASEDKIGLPGYMMVLQGGINGRLVEKPFTKYKMTGMFPLKKGGTKIKEITNHLYFNYCPFCGVKLSDPKPEPPETPIEESLA